MVINLKTKGQSTLEYAVVIAVIVGALLAASTYIKRGVQGRFKQASDDIGEQFSPGASEYKYTTTSSLGSIETTEPGTGPALGVSGTTDKRGGKTTSDSTQIVTKTGTEKVNNYNDTNEFWGNK